MRRLMDSKKGAMFQLLFLLIILFISAIVGLLFLTFTYKITESYEETGILNSTVIGTESNELIRNTAPYTTDYAIFFLFIGGIIGVCISAVRTNFSPVLIILFLFLLIITIFVASGFVNIYSGFAETGVMEESSEDLTITSFIFSRYTPLIFACLGGLIMVIMWSKTGGDIVT